MKQETCDVTNTNLPCPLLTSISLLLLQTALDLHMRGRSPLLSPNSLNPHRPMEVEPSETFLERVGVG